MPPPGLARQPSRREMSDADAPPAAPGAPIAQAKGVLLGAAAGKAMAGMGQPSAAKLGMGKWAFKSKLANAGAAQVKEFAEFGGGAAKGVGGARARFLANLARANGGSPLELVTMRLSAAHERAKALQVLGRHDEAVLDFNDVLDSQPAAPNALFRRGISHKALRDFAKAADDIETAKQLTARAEDRAILNLNYVGISDVEAVVLVAAGEEPYNLIRGIDRDEDIARAVSMRYN
jgi:tetratricopeptide (TPR) repeat protein